MEDYRSPNFHRIPYLAFSSLKGSLVLSLTTGPRLSHGGDFLSIYSGAPTRAHTLTQVHQGGGEEGTFGAGTLSSHSLLSQVNGLSPGYFWWISQPNGAVREIHDPGGES